MGNIQSSLCGIKPSGIWSYIDTVQLWLMKSLSKPEILWLRRICGKDKVYVSDKPAWWDYRFVQRLLIHQPPPEALQYFAQRDEVHINRVDVAIDWTFDSEQELRDAWRVFRETHIKPNHRDQAVRFVRGKKGRRKKRSRLPSRYTGQIWQHPQVCRAYRDKACRMTGEVYCLHVEWAMTGADTLKREGLASVKDIIKLDYRKFWAGKLLFKAVDRVKLGRLFWNYSLGTNRRTPWITKSKCGFEFYKDRRAGGLLWRSLRSTQAIIDKFRKEFRLDSCLVRLDFSHLLPRQSYD